MENKQRSITAALVGVLLNSSNIVHCLVQLNNNINTFHHFKKLLSNNCGQYRAVTPSTYLRIYLIPESNLRYFAFCKYVNHLIIQAKREVTTSLLKLNVIYCILSHPSKIKITKQCSQHGPQATDYIVTAQNCFLHLTKFGNV